VSVDLLTLEDLGEALSPPRRALLLAAQAPGPAPQAGEPLGRTHARILRLYQELAGSALEGTVDCPSCAATVELRVDVGEMLAAEPEVRADPAPLAAGDGSVRWRPVSYDDLVAAAEAEDDGRAVAAVLSRCVEGEVTEQLRPALCAAMAEADPLAEIEVDLACPECGEPVRAVLDVLDFTWAQVVVRAQVLLAEIDVLARVYSWSEPEILALPDARRRRFVELAMGGT
jgi:hypothetical protein